MVYLYWTRNQLRKGKLLHLREGIHILTYGRTLDMICMIVQFLFGLISGVWYLHRNNRAKSRDTSGRKYR